MKKKAGGRASKAVKGRKSGAPGRKAALLRARAAPRRSAAPRASGLADAKSAVRRLRQELAKARAEIEQLKATAETDFLLDILNRRGFERELSRSIAFIKRYSASGALLVLDVDRLKPINDAFGHAAGDHVLKAIAQTLASQVRASDVIGRLGGDEFAVLLWNLSETDARAKAAQLEQAIDGLRFSFGGRKVHAGASAGVAILDTHSEMRTALEQADSAMYVRKAQRRHEAG
ncbi:GGDEF domain-containing protein [Bradyrhizobium sp.]|uniref:GGDEF domain-containing protein n=1 Tax=Bradyrhizobium sp. TaxID=376 RepID=UPI001DB4F80F|nr:GGDEF domain-containing protein [Bradyrhizobium sp.]MBI5320925.1 GGDEF domain-containing protein [Bradyrhizobium sp.]